MAIRLNRRERSSTLFNLFGLLGTLLAVVGFFAASYGFLVLYDPSFIMWPDDAVLTFGGNEIEAELFPRYLTIGGIAAFVIGFAISLFFRGCTWCCRR